jgi:hypothetical protein
MVRHGILPSLFSCLGPIFTLPLAQNNLSIKHTVFQN